MRRDETRRDTTIRVMSGGVSRQAIQVRLEMEGGDNERSVLLLLLMVISFPREGIQRALIDCSFALFFPSFVSPFRIYLFWLVGLSFCLFVCLFLMDGWM